MLGSSSAPPQGFARGLDEGSPPLFRPVPQEGCVCRSLLVHTRAQGPPGALRGSPPKGSRGPSLRRVACAVPVAPPPKSVQLALAACAWGEGSSCFPAGPRGGGTPRSCPQGTGPLGGDGVCSLPLPRAAGSPRERRGEPRASPCPWAGSGLLPPEVGGGGSPGAETGAARSLPPSVPGSAGL